MRIALAALLLTGCSEYGLGEILDPADPPYDEEASIEDEYDWYGPDDWTPGDDDPYSDGSGDDGDADYSTGRMTGGGAVEAWSWGGNLACKGAHPSNALQLSWDDGSFHLEEVLWAVCWDDPALVPGNPANQADSISGEAIGRIGDREVTLLYYMTDDGEQGTTDYAAFLVSDGNAWHEIEGYLEDGNHQAHMPVSN